MIPQTSFFTRCVLCIILLCSCNTLFAQDILWEKSYGGKHADYLYDVVPTPDYGFILAGSSLSKKTGNKTEDNRGDLDYWVWKMDEKGNLDWQKTFGGNGQDKLNCILLTNDGGFLLAGTSSSDKGFDKKDKCRGESDFWVIKLNAKGGEEWQKTIGGSGQDELNSVVRTRDGGFVLAGSSSSEAVPITLVKDKDSNKGDKTVANYGSMDYWVVKIDRDGNIVWQNSFGGIYDDELRSIALTQDGGFILGGSSNSPDGGNKMDKCLGESDYWIIKLDDKGKQQWQKELGGRGDDQLYVVHQTTEGNYILGGNSNSESGDSKSKGNESGTDFWVVSLDKEGGMLWQETYNIATVDVLTSLVENDDHTFLLGGYAQGEVIKRKKIMGTLKKAIKGNEEPKMKQGTDDYVAIKINAKGEELWRKDVGSEGQDILKKVIETRDGGYLMAGTSKGKISNDRNSGIGSNDFWVVKLFDKSKPKADKLPVEAIPNPATDYTNIIVGYDFKKGTATLVDIAGHILQQFEITEKTIPINLQGYPVGVYVVNIHTDVQNSGVKIIKAEK